MASQKKGMGSSVIETNIQKGHSKFKKISKKCESEKDDSNQFICLGCGFVEKARFQAKYIENAQINVGFGFFQDGKRIMFCCFCEKCENIFN
jgi:hypothetical protein